MPIIPNNCSKCRRIKRRSQVHRNFVCVCSRQLHKMMRKKTADVTQSTCECVCCVCVCEWGNGEMQDKENSSRGRHNDVCNYYRKNRTVLKCGQMFAQCKCEWLYIYIRAVLYKFCQRSGFWFYSNLTKYHIAWAQCVCLHSYVCVLAANAIFNRSSATLTAYSWFSCSLSKFSHDFLFSCCRL